MKPGHGSVGLAIAGMVITGAFYVGLLDGLLGVAEMIFDS